MYQYRNTLPQKCALPLNDYNLYSLVTLRGWIIL